MDPTANITHDELTRVLNQHAHAYEALRWLSHISFARPETLTDQIAATLQHPESCFQWTLHNIHLFPARVRPDVVDADIFARLFASFFQTSFRIERRGHGTDSHLRIERHRDEAAGRDRLSTRAIPRGLKRKRKDQSHHLAYRALTQLADESTPGFWDAARDVLNDAKLKPETALWSWACELVHRSRGEAHGPAVHVLWQRLDHDTRQHMNSQIIWTARERVRNALHNRIRLQQEIKARQQSAR